MTRFIVDASVAVKWFVPEIHHEAARRLRDSSFELHVPNHFLLEFGNVAVKKTRRGEILDAAARVTVGEIRNLPIRMHSHRPFFPEAFDLALETSTSLYDSLYLKLAMHLDGEMVTADRKYVDAISGTEYEDALLWIEDIPDRGRP